MLVVDMTDPGAPDVLQVTPRDLPLVGTDEVLIRVAAAGVNRADLLQRQGLYPAPEGAPHWPGLEVSGVVVEVGSGVTRWAEGAEVCALLPGGGYAEFAAVHQDLVLPRAAGVDLVDCAALVESACTVWSNLEAAGAKAGEAILVHGGTGGIGSVAIQLAAARGLRVFATAGSNERVERCLELGAERAFDHRDDDWSDELASAGGVDIVLDIMGAAYLDRNVAALAPGGTLVVIGLQGGRKGELDLSRLMGKRAKILGSTLRSRPLSERAAIVAGVRRDVWPLVPHAVKPVVARRLPLADAAAAHALLEPGGVVGKILLLP
jgi:putative PIG3 family NAD(P)H quinone oxidoreductase